MVQGKLDQILIRLLAKSRLEEVGWDATADEGRFVTLLGNASITIQPGPVDGVYLVRVFNAAGGQVESTTLGGSNTMELYQLAKSRALQADDTLDEILRSLG